MSVTAVPDESAIAVELRFPAGAPVEFDTQALAELRASVEGFDTHLVEVRVDGEARTVVYEMLRTDVDPASARGRGLFHSVSVRGGTRDAQEFMSASEVGKLRSALPREHAECVLEVRAGGGDLRPGRRSRLSRGRVTSWTGSGSRSGSRGDTCARSCSRACGPWTRGPAWRSRGTRGSGASASASSTTSSGARVWITLGHMSIGP